MLSSHERLSLENVFSFSSGRETQRTDGQIEEADVRQHEALAQYIKCEIAYK